MLETVRCQTGLIRIVLVDFTIRFLFYREHRRFDEKRWALGVVARSQNLDCSSLWHPIGRDRPGRKRQCRARASPMKRDANRTPTAAAPVHPVLEFLDA